MERTLLKKMMLSCWWFICLFSRCSFFYLSSFFLLTYLIARPSKANDKRAGQRWHYCECLTQSQAFIFHFSFSFVRSSAWSSWLNIDHWRMVKWKTLSSLFVFLVVLLTYRKFDQFKQHINTTSDTYIKTILVFIHIQKTAGSEFERSIVRRLKFGLNSSCHCPSSSLLADQRKYGRVKLRCNCSNTEKQPWFVSRFSVGWLCGVHADWTTYHRCVAQKFDADFGVEKRRSVYFCHYLSFLSLRRKPHRMYSVD